MGLLRIKGVIELNQFWPVEDSDADTSKVIVRVEDGAFAFAEDESNFKVTHIFYRAKVRGTSKDYVVNKSRIRVRLQGIDAPELHFRAPALKKTSDISDEERELYNNKNRKFRQCLGESATVALSQKLATYGSPEVRCEVYSFVDTPQEVVDTYGRFIGNIRVGDGFRDDVNVWLTAEGWVFPTFYSSMRNDEITALLNAMENGKKEKRVWDCYSQDTNVFDYDLQYRSPKTEPQIDPQADRGPLLLPKLFRRQVTWWLGKEAGIWDGTLRDYLKQNVEKFSKTDEFLQRGVHPAPLYDLHEFIEQNIFALSPEQIVFKEKSSELVNEEGGKITDF